MCGGLQAAPGWKTPAARSLVGSMWRAMAPPGWLDRVGSGSGVLRGSVLSQKMAAGDAGSIFLVVWVLAGYVFFTLIALKLDRYTIFLIFPLVLFGVLAIIRGLPGRIAPYAALVLSVGMFSHTLASDHVPYVAGYRAAAQYVCSIAPPDSVVLFSSLRDDPHI